MDEVLVQHVGKRLRALGWSEVTYAGPGEPHPVYLTLQFRGVGPMAPDKTGAWTVGVGRANRNDFVILSTMNV